MQLHVKNAPRPGSAQTLRAAVNYSVQGVCCVRHRSGSPDYVSSCGIPLMHVVYQVVGCGRGNGRHSGVRSQTE